MATRKLVLGSAAGAVIAGAIMAAAPSHAQQAAGDPAQTYAGARAQYEAQLQDYNQKQQAYERQRREYNAEVDAYQRALNTAPTAPDTVVVVDDPDPEVVVVDPDRDRTIVVDDVPPGGTVVVTEPGPPDVIVARESDDFEQRLLIANVPPLVRLEDVAGLNREFFNEPVVDAAGVPVGHFRRVEVKDTWGGRLAAVITLDPSRRTIALPTDRVRLDPNRRIFIADMTARQIDTIPSGFPYG
jgi:hypothetical protein